MKNILFFLFLSTILVNCESNSPEEFNQFYHKNFGIIIQQEDRILHYPLHDSLAIWYRSPEGFNCREYTFDNCRMAWSNTDPIYVQPKREKEFMVLSSEHTCFPHPAYGSKIILFPIEEYAQEDPTFDHIEVRIEGQDSTAIIFSAKDIEGVPNTSELTVASQLWLLFFSSIDFEDPKLSDTPFMELVLVKKDGTRITKRNNSYPYPGCVAPLLEFFREGN